MYSYHIVAELRQFRGASGVTERHVHRTMPTQGNGIRLFRLEPGMDRIFLAIMASAVLLLIVASDLLVNGPAMQEPADLAMLPTSARLVR